MLYAPLVGIAAGLGAAGFFCALNFTQGYVLGHVEGYFPPSSGVVTENDETIDNDMRQHRIQESIEDEDCPFCGIDRGRVWLDNAAGIVLWDAYPLSETSQIPAAESDG